MNKELTKSEIQTLINAAEHSDSSPGWLIQSVELTGDLKFPYRVSGINFHAGRKRDAHFVWNVPTIGPGYVMRIEEIPLNVFAGFLREEKAQPMTL